MIPYILNVALIISVCLCFYKLLLRKETFYRLNRFILISILALSFIVPLIPVPQQWAFGWQQQNDITSTDVKNEHAFVDLSKTKTPAQNVQQNTSLQPAAETTTATANTIEGTGIPANRVIIKIVTVNVLKTSPFW